MIIFIVIHSLIHQLICWLSFIKMIFRESISVMLLMLIFLTEWSIIISSLVKVWLEFRELILIVYSICKIIWTWVISILKWSRISFELVILMFLRIIYCHIICLVLWSFILHFFIYFFINLLDIIISFRHLAFMHLIINFSLVVVILIISFFIMMRIWFLIWVRLI